MSRGSSERARAPATPPYTSYRTFRSFIDDLREHGLPSRVDRSLLTRYSGIVGTQLLHALKFLGLIDAEGRPCEALRALVQADAEGRWREALDALVRRSYAPLFAIDLESATPSHFNEAFRRAFPAADAVVQKCVTFFLYAAADAGVRISARVLKGRKPRLLAPRRRRPLPSPPAAPKPEAAAPFARSGAAPEPAGPPPAPRVEAMPPAVRKPSEFLLLHLEPDAMDEEQQAAVWTLLKYFRARGL